VEKKKPCGCYRRAVVAHKLAQPEQALNQATVSRLVSPVRTSSARRPETASEKSSLMTVYDGVINTLMRREGWVKREKLGVPRSCGMSANWIGVL